MVRETYVAHEATLVSGEPDNLGNRLRSKLQKGSGNVGDEFFEEIVAIQDKLLENHSLFQLKTIEVWLYTSKKITFVLVLSSEMDRSILNWDYIFLSPTWLKEEKIS